MSTIDEMIGEMCPDGVKYRRLGDVTVMKRGTSLTKKKAEEGSIPAISGGRQPAFYCNQSNREGETITVAGSGAGAGFVQYWNEPIFACDCFTVKGTEALDTRYVYHWMASMQDAIYSCKKGGGVPHVHISDIDSFLIPVPPLAVQRDVVKVLDTFTELTDELTTALKAEEEARKQQYAYYMDEMLRLDGVEGVEWKRLGEIGKFYGGLTGKNKYDFDNGNALFATYKNVYANPALDTRVAETVNISSGEKQNALAYGDIIFTGSSETPDECGLSSVVTEQLNEEIYLNSFCFFLRLNEPDTLCPDFAKHLFRSSSIRKQIVRTANGVTRFNVSKEKIKNVLIPIPPIEAQKDMANKLDAFSSYCTDLTTGLPAEIAAREKQYAYYRDRMLSFPVQKK